MLPIQEDALETGNAVTFVFAVHAGNGRSLANDSGAESWPVFC